MQEIQLRIETLLQRQPEWLLLDAAACPEPLWFARGIGAPMYSLFVAQDAALAENGPWLIDIAAYPDMLSTTLKQDVYGHGSLWFNSRLSGSALCQTLQQRVYCQLPNGEISRFRWYDPRVLHRYLSDDTLTHQVSFLAPFDELLYAALNPFDFLAYFFHWQQGECSILPIIDHAKVAILNQPMEYF